MVTAKRVGTFCEQLSNLTEKQQIFECFPRTIILKRTKPNFARFWSYYYAIQKDKFYWGGSAKFQGGTSGKTGLKLGKCQISQASDVFSQFVKHTLQHSYLHSADLKTRLPVQNPTRNFKRL